MNNKKQENKKEKKIKKPVNGWYISFLAIFWVLAAAMILTSGNIIPWDRIVPNSVYNVPLYARILASIFFPILVLSYAFFVVLKEKMSVWRLINYVFIIGIIITLFWVPRMINVNEGRAKAEASWQPQWLLFPYDVTVVFGVCVILYALCLYFVTPKFVSDIRLKTQKLLGCFKKQKSILEEEPKN
ncbi:hypothetical protein U5U50_01985 [Mycoplasma sp. 888]|uniref:hypothetical protein n=1 Tax=Mycoplasma sp. 888 TaxID=3108483 RepID=UPI002D78151E|nr:hypothetical protein [Mycoplasma sp. 888]WRQ25565.1 hypothetical protein U5U50_01985 [Mycoplasma sp. 888]